jgi:hypothetical protein
VNGNLILFKDFENPGVGDAACESTTQRQADAWRTSR